MIGLYTIMVFSPSIFAQQKIEYSFQVLQVAGNQIYLEWQDDIPETEWPNIDQRMSIYSEGEYLGELKIFAVQAPRFVATFEDVAFNITRGTIISGRWELEVSSEEVSVIDETEDRLEAETDTNIVSVPASLLDRESNTLAVELEQDQSIIQNLSGRFILGSNLYRSTTQWSEVVEEKDIRWSSVSYSNINMRYRDREKGLNMQLSGRNSYRAQTNSIIDQTTITNIYNVFVSKEFDKRPIQIQLGRFYNSNEFSNPYWDGVKIEHQTRLISVGFLSGWEPKRSNEGIQFDWFKSGVFVSNRGSFKNLRWSNSAHSTTYLPKNGNQHALFGLDHYLRIKDFRIQAEFQWENEPANTRVENSRIRLRSSYAFAKWLDVDMYYYKRKPYLLDAIEPSFLSNRTRYGFDIKHSINQWYISYGVSNYDRSGQISTTYNARLLWQDSPIWNIDWSLYSSYWDAVTGHSITTGLSATKRVERSFYSAGINVYDSKVGLNENTNGSLFANASIQLNNNFSLNVRVQSTYGNLITRNGFSLSMLKRF